MKTKHIWLLWLGMMLMATTLAKADTTFERLTALTNYQADGTTKFSAAAPTINFTSGDRDEQYLEASIDITPCDENAVKLRNIFFLGQQDRQMGNRRCVIRESAFLLYTTSHRGCRM